MPNQKPDICDGKKLAALLRLKRFEQPHPGYHESFLRDFHRRQRTDLATVPVWRIALDRFQAFFMDVTIPRAAYAGAFGVFLLVATGIGLVRQDSTGVSAAAVASVQSTGPSAPASNGIWEGHPQLPSAMPTVVAMRDTRTASATRYVLDARPVSYEMPLRF